MLVRSVFFFVSALTPLILFGCEVGESEATVTGKTACGGAIALSDRAFRTVNPDMLDRKLIDDAIRFYSSAARCGEGGELFEADSALLDVAEDHSEDMARLDFFAHDSEVEGKTSLVDRYTLGEVSYRAAAENLALVGLFNFPNGEQFEVIDVDECRFRDPETKTYYRRQTYAELAALVVDGWMNSPGHRANLLNDRYSRMGSGIAINTDNEYCGWVYATQNFAD